MYSFSLFFFYFMPFFFSLYVFSIPFLPFFFFSCTRSPKKGGGGYWVFCEVGRGWIRKMEDLGGHWRIRGVVFCLQVLVKGSQYMDAGIWFVWLVGG